METNGFQFEHGHVDWWGHMLTLLESSVAAQLPTQLGQCALSFVE